MPGTAIKAKSEGNASPLAQLSIVAKEAQRAPKETQAENHKHMVRVIKPFQEIKLGDGHKCEMVEKAEHGAKSKNSCSPLPPGTVKIHLSWVTKKLTLHPSLCGLG